MASKVVARNQIGLSRICLIDTLPSHLQTCLENSISPPPFNQEDVSGLSGRGKDWHEAEMQKLGDFVIEMLDNTDNVIEYLAEASVLGDYRPQDLMPLILVKQAQMDQAKAQLSAQFDNTNYYRAFPKGW